MKVHHLEIACRNIEDQLGTFSDRFGFAPFAVQAVTENGNTPAVALRRGDISLVLREERSLNIDTLYDVAIQVDNVEERCSLVSKSKGVILRRTTTEQDGAFTSAVVKAPIGNVQHTIITRKETCDYFLPGFEPIQSYMRKFKTANNQSCQAEHESLYHILVKYLTVETNGNQEKMHLDHVAFAAKPDTSLGYIKWYHDCFNFERFKVNDQETEDGFVIEAYEDDENLKMKLLATEMKYHFCSEVGCHSERNNNDVNGNETSNVTFVFGESFPNQGPNQIQTFITEHEGEGVQHIAMHSDNIFETTLTSTRKGVDFMHPPKCYYDEMDLKLKRMNGYDRDLCEKMGVLIDVEKQDSSKEEGYLLQIFSKPIFSRRTLFIELITRHNSTGFGAGNISALWKAYHAFCKEQGIK